MYTYQVFRSHRDLVNLLTSEKMQRSPSTKSTAISGATAINELAQFRYALRKFLRFSESSARACGVTPQQHQLMLGVAGFTGRGCATVSELAEFLQEMNHSVVGLVYRAVQSGLVKRKRDATDRRVVVVQLTARGERILMQLSDLHHREIENIGGLFPTKKAPAVRKV
jgi:DNA-binding MarR family transcriptional regulator